MHTEQMQNIVQKYVGTNSNSIVVCMINIIWVYSLIGKTASSKVARCGFESYWACSNTQTEGI
jgi:hypothetical protein